MVNISVTDGPTGKVIVVFGLIKDTIPFLIMANPYRPLLFDSMEGANKFIREENEGGPLRPLELEAEELEKIRNNDVEMIRAIANRLRQMMVN